MPAPDPRTFLVKKCRPDYLKEVQTQEKNRNILKNLGKIGDLEILNDIGLSKVGEGLRALTKVSNIIRTGDGTLSQSVDNGVSYVLSSLGIDPGSLDVLADFRPDVVNRAVDQAKFIYEKIKQGNFEISDIPEYVQDFQYLWILANNIFQQKKSDPRAKAVCEASPYAVDLIRWAPKFKFLFIVEFIFSNPYSDLNELGTAVAFVVKSSTRPSIEYEMDQINKYNYFTEVVKRTIFQPMTMRFYDDNRNAAMTFYNAYLKAMTPISNVENPALFEAESMKFDKSGTYLGKINTKEYSSVLGTLDGNVRFMIQEARLYQIYQYGSKVNIFRFFNPRIRSLELDDVSMSETGEGTEVAITFSYDSMNLVTNYSLKDLTSYDMKTSLDGAVNIEKLTGGSQYVKANYPIKPLFDSQTGDTSSAVVGGKNQTPTEKLIQTQSSIVSDAFLDLANFSGSVFV